MIFPFLDGFLTFSRAPITWLIILLNVFLFSQFYASAEDCQSRFEAWYADTDYLHTQGQAYKQFRSEREIASVNDMEMLGRLAFRDEEFMQQAPSSAFVGDQIALDFWKKDLRNFLILRGLYPPLLLGVSDYNKDFFSFISYQFYHEGFYHLLGNLLLILLIGAYLERRYSGSVVFAVYIMGGFFGAYMFSLTGATSGAPLVGASGSLCSLLGFLLVVENTKKTRLFYMILPMKKYMGFVMIPTVYWVLWLCMLEDVTGWLAQPSAIASGVAHRVHIFGFLIGIMLAVVYLIVKVNLDRVDSSRSENQMA